MLCVEALWASPGKEWGLVEDAEQEHRQPGVPAVGRLGRHFGEGGEEVACGPGQDQERPQGDRGGALLQRFHHLGGEALGGGEEPGGKVGQGVGEGGGELRVLGQEEPPHPGGQGEQGEDAEQRVVGERGGVEPDLGLGEGLVDAAPGYAALTLARSGCKGWIPAAKAGLRCLISDCSKFLEHFSYTSFMVINILFS